MCASAISHLVFEFSEVGLLLRCLFTEVQSCHPSPLLLFCLRHNWESEAHLGQLIGSYSPLFTYFFQIVEYPAKVSECDSTTMFTDRNSESSQTSWSGVLVLPGCRMQQ